MVPVRVAMSLALLAGCSGEPADFSSGHTEGSLAPFFDNPEAGCTCQLDLRPEEWQVQYACYPDFDDYTLTFYATLPPSANQRGVSLTTLQLGHPDWVLSGFGDAATELTFGSDGFGHPGLDEADQVSEYREVFLWAIDVQAQRICEFQRDDRCIDLPAGRAEDVRMTCSVGLE